MFLLKGLLVEFLEWVLNKLRGYTQFYNCLVPECNFQAASNDPGTIVKVAETHDKYHREHS